MKIEAQKCLNCGDILYSRSRHDFRYCFCGSMYVDGGPVFEGSTGSYNRVGGNFDEIKSIEYESELNAGDIVKRLWDDYNLSIDRYGGHRDLEYTDEVREAAKAKRLLSV